MSELPMTKGFGFRREGNVPTDFEFCEGFEERNMSLHRLVDFLDWTCHEGFDLENDCQPDKNGQWHGGTCSIRTFSRTAEGVVINTAKTWLRKMQDHRETGMC